MRLKMLHMKCVQTSVEMLDLMIPELGERDEIENFDSVDTEWSMWKWYFSTFPFEGDSGIKIALPGKDSPFSWLKGFLVAELVNYGRNKPVCTPVPQYSWTVTVLSRPHLTNMSQKMKCGQILLITRIDRWPEIEDYWSTKPFMCSPWYGQKSVLPSYPKDYRSYIFCYHVKPTDS